MLFSVTAFGYAVSALAEVPLSRRRQRLESKVVQQYGGSLSPMELQNILRSANPDAANDESATCSKAAFVVAMLIKLNKLQPSQVRATA